MPSRNVVSQCYTFHFSTRGVPQRTSQVEKGLQLFGEETEYVLRYLRFLISVNDKIVEWFLRSRRNHRFESGGRCASAFRTGNWNILSERGRPLWERGARYEYQYGDLEAALKLEKRIAEAHASGTSRAHLRMMISRPLRFIS